MNGLKFAIGYFSIFKVNITKEFTQNTANTTLFFIPFVGLFLGLFTIGVYFIISSYLNHLYSGLVAGCIYLASYGFLHLEGLIDTIDGYYGKLGGKDPYTIMKEPHVGAMGIVWVISFVILKLATISYLLSLGGLWIFVSIIILSRLSVTFVLSFFDVLDSSILAKFFQNASRTFYGNSSAIISIFIVIYLSRLNGIILAVLGFVIAMFSIYKLKKAVGFINGDILGANIEITELLLLFIGVSLS